MSKPEASFDEYAQSYDADLNQGLQVSGEGKEYFARGRVAWLAKCLRQAGAAVPEVIMDFGCGSEGAVEYLHETWPAAKLWGVDVSAESLASARSRHAHLVGVEFRQRHELQPQEQVDLVFCNGVFHHIPLAERSESLAYIYNSLRKGGYFAFWENNPWNLGTRYVMSRIPFDRDAILVNCLRARKMLAAAGFAVMSTNFLFIFPGFLRHLRFLEPAVSWLPLGGQYQVLCRKD